MERANSGLLADLRIARTCLASVRLGAHSPAPSVESIRPIHATLLAALDKASVLSAGERDADGLALRRAQLQSRLQLASDRQAECPAHVAVERLASYLRAAERLLDSLVFDFVQDSQELNAARQRVVARLEDSLKLRRAFATFRISINQAQRQSSQASRLRSSAMALATLLGCEAHTSLRACDREVFWSLQRRLRESLRHEPVHIPESQRLLDDLVAASSIVGQISQREELQIHDSSLISDLPPTRPETEDASFRHNLMQLFGLSRSLDIALASGSPLTDQQYESIKRLANREFVYFEHTNPTME